MRRFLPVRTGRDRGVVIPMVALSLTVLMTMTAFAVDLGRMRTERRDLQADADAIALDALQMIAGLSWPAAQLAAVAEANESAARNGFDVVLTDAEVQVGIWHVDQQFFDPAPPDVNARPDAVRVQLGSSVPMFFDFSTDERSVSRTAVAVSRAQTMGGLGSVVAGIQPAVQDPTTGCAVGAAASIQMTVMNYVYTKLLGIQAEVAIQGEVDQDVSQNHSCQVSGPADGMQVNAISYHGLGASRLTFRDLASELSVGDSEALADSQLSQSELLSVSGQAFQRGQDPTSLRYQVGTQLRAIAGEADSTTKVRFGDTFQSTTGGQDAVLDTSLTALDLLLMTATMVNSKNFVGANGGLTVPLPLGAGGAMVNVPMKVHVVERPQFDTEWKFAGQNGPKTSQVSVTLDVPLSFSNLPVDLTVLGLAGIGSTATASGTGTLPLVIEVGRATSSYPSIQCPTDGSPTIVNMRVNSGAARVRVAKTTDTNFSDGVTVQTPGSLVVSGSAQVPLVSVAGISIGSSTVDLKATTTVPSFGQTFDSSGAYTLNLSSSLEAGGGSAVNPFEVTPPDPTAWFRYRGGLNNVAVTDSVLGSFNFGSTSTGLIGSLTEAQSDIVRNQIVQKAVDPVLARLDSTVLQPLFNALGLTLGGADAQILRARCQVPALANRP